jgi:hypothetical protein
MAVSFKWASAFFFVLQSLASLATKKQMVLQPLVR